MLFLCLVLLLAVNLLIFLRIARHCIFRGSNYFQWLDHFVFNNIPMILLMCLLLLLAIDLLLFLRNTSHSLFRWVKVFVLYLVHKILLLCILLLLLGINLSSCSILKRLFVFKVSNLLGFPILLPNWWQYWIPLFFHHRPVILPSLWCWVTPPYSIEHDGFIGWASKEAQSGSIVTHDPLI